MRLPHPRWNIRRQKWNAHATAADITSSARQSRTPLEAAVAVGVAAVSDGVAVADRWTGYAVAFAVRNARACAAGFSCPARSRRLPFGAGVPVCVSAKLDGVSVAHSVARSTLVNARKDTRSFRTRAGRACPDAAPLITGV